MSMRIQVIFWLFFSARQEEIEDVSSLLRQFLQEKGVQVQYQWTGDRIEVLQQEDLSDKIAT